MKSDNAKTNYTEHITTTIQRTGPISYAELMEDALYGQPHGYYTTARNRNTNDYLTAPTAHPAFGALIALQLHQMWQLMGSHQFNLIELGAGAGTLISDISNFVNANLPDFGKQLKLRAVDKTSVATNQFKTESLKDFDNANAVVGCILSNELLDAMPVHKFIIKAGKAHEIRIGIVDNALVDITDEQPSQSINAALEPDLQTLPDDYQGEINLNLDDWTAKLAQNLAKGYVITIDYGLKRAQRQTGSSLRTYRNHVQNRNPLANISEQDITADVDFGALERAFTNNGFELNGTVSQQQFLENLGAADWLQKLRSLNLPQRQKQANIAGLLRLLAPEGFGGFTVYIHSRNTPSKPLNGLIPNPKLETAQTLLPPLLDENPNHTYIQDEWGSLGGYNICG